MERTNKQGKLMEKPENIYFKMIVCQIKNIDCKNFKLKRSEDVQCKQNKQKPTNKIVKKEI